MILAPLKKDESWKDRIRHEVQPGFCPCQKPAGWSGFETGLEKRVNKGQPEGWHCFTQSQEAQADRELKAQRAGDG